MGSTERKTFYDQHPFDWVPPNQRGSMRAVVSPALADLIESLDAKALVLDIGCGPGRVLGFLVRRGVPCIGLDRSRISVGLAAERYNCPGVVGDNLRLPFADGSAGVVISDGVIHHTEDPRAAFFENCRILKPGGRMYLAVYKPAGRYPLLYKFPGALIRYGVGHSWTRPLVFFAQVPYFAIHFLRSRGKRTWAGARNLFFDYFVTPHVEFLPRQAIEDWCARQGTRVILYDENRGANVHSFVLEKELSCEPQPDPAVDSNARSPVCEQQGAV
jgi:SAM-dependent methyltransferase